MTQRQIVSYNYFITHKTLENKFKKFPESEIDLLLVLPLNICLDDPQSGRVGFQYFRITLQPATR